MKVKPYEQWFIWKALIKIQRVIAGAAVLTILFTMSTCVVLRYIIGQDIVGSDEICCVAALWLYFIGSSLGSMEDSHIQANIMETVFKNNNKMLYCLELFKNAIILFVLVYFTKWSIDFWNWNMETGQLTPYFRMPLMYSKGAVTVGFIGMTIYTLLRFARQLYGLPKALKGTDTLKGVEA